MGARVRSEEPRNQTKGGAARTLAALGEFGFLAKILPDLTSGSDVLVGPGDDCAAIRGGRVPWLLTIDALVEGTHFKRPWLTPYQLGRKSFLINASDIAAMGGQPRHALVAIGAPPRLPVIFLERVEAGIVAAAADFGADVIGGNLTRSPLLSITIALVGTAPTRIVRRCGAKAGDAIYVTGRLGDAAFALHWLSKGKRGRRPATALRRFVEPIPRVGAGRTLAQSGLASAMIDISDGLVQDLAHLCEQSGCGAEINVDRVPCSRQVAGEHRFALSGGEDYELLFTVPAARSRALERVGFDLGCPITRIGKIVSLPRGKAVRLLREDGREVHLDGAGFDHFRR